MLDYSNVFKYIIKMEFMEYTDVAAAEKFEIKKLFERASQINIGNCLHMTTENWHELRSLDGAKRFKRKALGLCGRESVKSLDEMGELLYKTRIASSIEEGKTMIPNLNNVQVWYRVTRFPCPISSAGIGFQEVDDLLGRKKYRVYVFLW